MNSRFRRAILAMVFALRTHGLTSAGVRTQFTSRVRPSWQSWPWHGVRPRDDPAATKPTGSPWKRRTTWQNRSCRLPHRHRNRYNWRNPWLRRHSASNQNGIGILRLSRTHGHITAGLHDFIESRTVYHAVFDDGETGGTPRLHGNRIAVLELTHIELAGGGTAFGLAVGRTVDVQRTHTADAFCGNRGRIRTVPCPPLPVVHSKCPASPGMRYRPECLSSHARQNGPCLSVRSGANI